MSHFVKVSEGNRTFALNFDHVVQMSETKMPDRTIVSLTLDNGREVSVDGSLGDILGRIEASK